MYGRDSRVTRDGDQVRPGAPPTPNSKNSRLIIGVCAIVLAIAITVAAIAVITAPYRVTGYGRESAKVLRSLDVCDVPERTGDQTAECEFADGTVVAISPESAMEQEMLISAYSGRAAPLVRDRLLTDEIRSCRAGRSAYGRRMANNLTMVRRARLGAAAVGMAPPR